MSLLTSGAAIVQLGDGPRFETYGRWHASESPACWASVTKVFVAALTQHLVNGCVLEWDAPVGSILGVAAPDYMTVSSLVTHTSGLPRVLPEQEATRGDPYQQWTAPVFDARVLHALDELAQVPMAGTFAYSNLGYAVLERIIEKVTGRRWIELVGESIIAPLGLPEDIVGLPPVTSSPDRTSNQVVAPRDVRGRYLTDWDVSTGPFAAAGGLCATVPAMFDVFRASFTSGGLLTSTSGPNAWVTSGTRLWHTGATLRSGCAVTMDRESKMIGVVHASGGRPGRGVTYAERTFTRLLSQANLANSDEATGV